jgi:hypothetical protein
MGVTSGKWYFEATYIVGSGGNSFIGWVNGTLSDTTANDLGFYANEYSIITGNGNKYNNNTFTAYGSAIANGDIIGCALDLDTGTMTFYKNNTSFGTAFSSLPLGDFWFPGFDAYNNNGFDLNFGQRPFSYTPPTGFVRLNTYNLPDSTIVKGNTVMDATLYTGNGSTQTITNAASFKPDFVWVKGRSVAYVHGLFDSVRGVGKNLNSASTNAENSNDVDGYLSSFNNNGFTLIAGSTSSNTWNQNATTYVGWQWQAGAGTTSTNTSGSISSTVSVNATAGFSVVTYTGTGANATVGHGLGVAPKMLITKDRTGGGSWQVYHVSLGNTGGVYLNTTGAFASGSGWWNNTSPTSTTISIGTNGEINTNGRNYVAYCWAEIAGFSKFGSYTGNGSADGPFVYLGFRPKFVMIKKSSSTGSWAILDTARNTYNVANTALYADLISAENSSFEARDYLSNGFKLRTTDQNSNENGSTFIYMAFAENPFKNSNAR